MTIDARLLCFVSAGEADIAAKFIADREEIWEEKQKALESVEADYDQMLATQAREYCATTTKHPIGTTITAPWCSIVVDKINFLCPDEALPEYVYTGKLLTKAGTLRKDEKVGRIKQSDIIKDNLKRKENV